MVPIGFFSGKSSEGSVQGRSLGSTVVPISGLMLLSSLLSFLFPAFSICLSFTTLFCETELVHSCPTGVPPNFWVSWSLTHSPFPRKGISFQLGVPFGDDQCQPGCWGDAGKIKAVFFIPISCSQVFLPLFC